MCFGGTQIGHALYLVACPRDIIPRMLSNWKKLAIKNLMSECSVLRLATSEYFY
jgi:hypothetical protein